MKANLLALTVAAFAAGAVVPAISHADQGMTGFFINGQVGQATLNKGVFDDDDVGYAGNVGYRWALTPEFKLGVEGGYTKLGDFKGSQTLGGVPANYEASLKGWTLGVNGKYNFTPNWYVSGRGGAFRWDGKARETSGPASLTFLDSTSTDWYAGAGFGYDFSSNVSVGLNYDHFAAKKSSVDLTTNLVSVSGEYRF